MIFLSQLGNLMGKKLNSPSIIEFWKVSDQDHLDMHCRMTFLINFRSRVGTLICLVSQVLRLWITIPSNWFRYRAV